MSEGRVCTASCRPRGQVRRPGGVGLQHAACPPHRPLPSLRPRMGSGGACGREGSVRACGGWQLPVASPRRCARTRTVDRSGAQAASQRCRSRERLCARARRHRPERVTGPEGSPRAAAGARTCFTWPQTASGPLVGTIASAGVSSTREGANCAWRTARREAAIVSGTLGVEGSQTRPCARARCGGALCELSSRRGKHLDCARSSPEPPLLPAPCLVRRKRLPFARAAPWRSWARAMSGG